MPPRRCVKEHRKLSPLEEKVRCDKPAMDNSPVSDEPKNVKIAPRHALLLCEADILRTTK